MKSTIFTLNEKRIQLIKDVLTAVVLAGLLSLAVKPTLVKGESMEPNFHDGDYLIANRLYNFNNLKKDDVVIFRYDDGRLFIKRVIGLPGDDIRIEDGKVYVNGKEDDQSYTLDKTTDGETELTVPDNEIFCMGDNRLNSHDSRADDIGCVDKKIVKGKVVMRLYPFTRIKIFGGKD